MTPVETTCAWVSLWIPIDKLVWSTWTHRNDRAVYERVKAMTFTLEPQPDHPAIDDATLREHNKTRATPAENDISRRTGIAGYARLWLAWWDLVLGHVQRRTGIRDESV